MNFDYPRLNSRQPISQPRNGADCIYEDDHREEPNGCCCKVPPKDAVIIICIISTLLSVYSSISIYTNHRVEKGNWKWKSFELKILFLISDYFALAMLFVAAIRQNHRLILPFMFLESFYVMLFSTLAFFCVWAFLKPTSVLAHTITVAIASALFDGATVEVYDDPRKVQLINSFAALLLSTTAGVCFWWAKVALNCYHLFLLDNRRKHKSLTNHSLVLLSKLKFDV